MSQVMFDLVFILLLGIQLEAAYVEPPTNVTLDCRNLVHVVKWSYTEFSPELQFKIYIGSRHSAPKEFLVDSPNLQANFLLDTDPADTYSLLVSAVAGQSESDEEPPQGIQFSYRKSSTASKRCFMDLPAVNVTVTHDGVANFSFMHPWLLHGHNIPVTRSKSMKKKRHDEGTEDIPMFEYSVVIVGKKQVSGPFYCTESECEEQLFVDSHEKLCLEISGEMENMAVRGTQEYCAIPAPAPRLEDDYTYLYIVVPLLVLTALVFILFMVYKKFTTPSSTLPSSMTFKDHLWRAVGARDQSSVPVSVPEVEPASPTPLLTHTEFPPATTSSPEPEDREWIGDNGVLDDGEIGNGEGGYSQGRNLDEDDDMETNVEAPSGYEKRPGV